MKACLLRMFRQQGLGFLLLSLVSLSLIGCREVEVKSTLTPPPYLYKNCIVASSSSGISLDWDSDVSYSIEVNEKEKSLRISGDRLIIDSAHFASIVRPIDSPISNYSKVTFDARHITIAGPLSFLSAKLRFLASEIEIGPNGFVALVGKPTSADGLEIISRKLVVQNGYKKRILFKTRPAGQGGESRTVKIVAEQIEVNGKGINSVGSAAKALGRLSMDYPDVPEKMSDSWMFKVGNDASPIFNQAFTDEMVWPSYFSAKASKWFSRSSYDKEFNERLKLVITNELLLLGKWSSLTPSANAERIIRLIDLGLDNDGNSQETVPRVGIQYQIDVLKEKLSNSEKYFTALRRLIVDAYDNDKAIESNAEKLRVVRSQLESFSADANTHMRMMDKLLTEAIQLEQEIQSRENLLGQRHDVHMRRKRDAEEKAEDLKKLGFAKTVLVLGAAMVPATSPVAMGVATGAAVTADLVYQHNTGNQVSVESVLQTVESVKELSAKYREKLTEAKSQWDGVRKDWKNLQSSFSKERGSKTQSQIDESRKNAATSLKGSAATFFETMKEWQQTMQSIPRPTTLSIDQIESDDEEFKALAVELGRLRGVQAEINGKIQEENKALQTLREDELKHRSMESDLMAVRPRNDIEVARWKASALSLWQAYMASLYRDAVLLRRAFFFETGEFPGMDQEALFFPDETIAYMAAGLFDPSGKAKISELVNEHLVLEEAKTNAAVGGLINAVESGIRDHLAKRTSRDFVRHYFKFREDSNNKAIVEFIQAVNRQIEVAIHRNYQNETLYKGLPGFIPLYIPLELPPSISPFPERFVRAVVGNVGFFDEGAVENKSLRFVIQHPGFGTMVRNGDCFRYDLRSRQAENRIFRTTIVGDKTIANMISDESDAIRMDPLGMRYYTLYPARAPYFMTVQVDGDSSLKSWTRIPKIREMEVALEVMQ